MRLPGWYGRRYPTLQDLEDHAWDLGAMVVRGPIYSACIVYSNDPEDCTVICLPAGLPPLEEHWQLAHELGHLTLHAGYTTPWAHGRQEAQADRWAARALIPQARVRAHANASVDAFVAALSAHYEEIPLEDCATRHLAGKIARVRLGLVEEVA